MTLYESGVPARVLLPQNATPRWHVPHMQASQPVCMEGAGADVGCVPQSCTCCTARRSWCLLCPSSPCRCASLLVGSALAVSLLRAPSSRRAKPAWTPQPCAAPDVGGRAHRSEPVRASAVRQQRGSRRPKYARALQLGNGINMQPMVQLRHGDIVLCPGPTMLLHQGTWELHQGASSGVIAFGSQCCALIARAWVQWWPTSPASSRLSRFWESGSRPCTRSSRKCTQVRCCSTGSLSAPQHCVKHGPHLVSATHHRVIAEFCVQPELQGQPMPSRA